MVNSVVNETQKCWIIGQQTIAERNVDGVGM